jgi:hypothetical protein
MDSAEIEVATGNQPGSVKLSLDRTISESNAQALPSSKQPKWVIVCSVGVGFSHLMGAPLGTVADFGKK